MPLSRFKRTEDPNPKIATRAPFCVYFHPEQEGASPLVQLSGNGSGGQAWNKGFQERTLLRFVIMRPSPIMEI